MYIPLVLILLHHLLNKFQKYLPRRAELFLSSVSLISRCFLLLLHVLKPAAYSLETPHPSPSLLPALQHQPVTHSLTHAHSHSPSHTGHLSPHSLASVCVCVCVRSVRFSSTTWNNAVIPLAACGLSSVSGSSWSSWSGLETVTPPTPPAPPSSRRTAAWTAYGR